MATSGTRSQIKYMYQLPYKEERELCTILDLNDQWEELGGNFMKFSVLDLYEIRRVEKCGESPTRRLLQIWGQRNNTIWKLYRLLYEMQHYQAMTVLEPYVPEKYHVLEQDTDMTRALAQLEQTSISNRHHGPNYGTSRSSSENHNNRRDSPKHTTINHNLDQTSWRSSSNESPKASKSKIPESFLQPSRRDMSSKSQNGHKIMNRNGNRSSVSMAESCEENSCRGCPKKHRDADRGFEYQQKRYPDGGADAPSRPNAVRQKDRASVEQKSQSIATNPSARSDISVLSDCSVPMISYQELETATEQFDSKNLLGKGGFGSVFKGTWKLSKVAVKKMNMDPETVLGTMPKEISETLDELRYLQSFRHKNILQVFAFSADPGRPPCLVYELMESGSLEERLQCRKRLIDDRVTTTRCDPLSWQIRLKIAQGTASALHYLHTVKNKPIIHGDVKSANILLEKDLEPKLGDFGLAREGPQSNYTSVKVTRVNGTRAYIPSEYLRDRKLSTKVDTYSFGIVLFEICTGQRAYDAKRTPHFMKPFIDEIEEKDLRSVIDTKAGNEFLQIFDPLMNLGIKCTNDKHNRRPDMITVYQTLEELTNCLMEEILRRTTEQSTPRATFLPVYQGMYPGMVTAAPSVNYSTAYPYMSIVGSSQSQMIPPHYRLLNSPTNCLPVNKLAPPSGAIPKSPCSTSPPVIAEESSEAISMEGDSTNHSMESDSDTSYLPNLTGIGKKSSFLD